MLRNLAAALLLLLRRRRVPLPVGHLPRGGGGGGGSGWGSPRRRFLGLAGGLGLALGLKLAAGDDGGDQGGVETPPPPKGFSRAVESGRDLLRRVKDEIGVPGIVVGVTVDGEAAWSEGFGYADVENRVLCKPETVLRIASISKPLTMVAVAKLWEEGKLDLDAPVQKYVPEFPEKECEGEKVTITARQLASHLSGIRHYEKDAAKAKEEKDKAAGGTTKADQGGKKDRGSEKRDSAKAKLEPEDTNSKGGKKTSEFEQKEYYLKEKFDNVMDALNMFKNDPLFFKPGSQFWYSTHGFTLLSAVVERTSGQKFTDYMMKIFCDLDMSATGLDDNESLIYNRARYYIHNEKGHLVNAPYVDNSYKWAGGGFLSTVVDLVKFGNAMLYSYQLGQLQDLSTGLLPGYLKPSTVAMMWTALPSSEPPWHKDGQYGMGWLVAKKKQECGFCRQPRHFTSHSGGAIGGSSILLILPEKEDLGAKKNGPLVPPRGVVVAIICNMQSVPLKSTALKIAMEFEKDKLAQHADKSSFCLQ